MRGIDMQEEKEIFSCPVEATLSLIGGKYKPLILWHLIEQPLHYMELQRLIPKATATRNATTVWWLGSIRPKPDIPRSPS